MNTRALTSLAAVALFNAGVGFAATGTTTTAPIDAPFNMDQLIPDPAVWIPTIMAKLGEAGLFPDFCKFALALCFVLSVYGMVSAFWGKRDVPQAFKVLIVGAVCTALLTDLSTNGPTAGIPKAVLGMWTSAYNASNTVASKVFKEDLSKNTQKLAGSIAKYVANTTMSSRAVASVNFNKIVDTKDAGGQAINQSVITNAMSQARGAGDEMARTASTQSWIVAIAYYLIIGLFMLYSGLIVALGMSVLLTIFALPFAVSVIPIGNTSAVQKILFGWLGAIATAALLPFVFATMTSLALGLPQQVLAKMVDGQNRNADVYATKYVQAAVGCKGRSDWTKLMDDASCTQAATLTTGVTELGKEGINIMLAALTVVLTFMVGMTVAGIVLRMVPGVLNGVIGGLNVSMGGMSDKNPMGAIGKSVGKGASAAGEGIKMGGAVAGAGIKGGSKVAAGVGGAALGMGQAAVAAGGAAVGAASDAFKSRSSGGGGNKGKVDLNKGAAAGGDKSGSAGKSGSADKTIDVEAVKNPGQGEAKGGAPGANSADATRNSGATQDKASSGGTATDAGGGKTASAQQTTGSAAETSGASSAGTGKPPIAVDYMPAGSTVSGAPAKDAAGEKAAPGSKGTVDPAKPSKGFAERVKDARAAQDSSVAGKAAQSAKTALNNYAYAPWKGEKKNSGKDSSSEKNKSGKKDKAGQQDNQAQQTADVSAGATGGTGSGTGAANRGATGDAAQTQNRGAQNRGAQDDSTGTSQQGRQSGSRDQTGGQQSNSGSPRRERGQQTGSRDQTGRPGQQETQRTERGGNRDQTSKPGQDAAGQEKTRRDAERSARIRGGDGQDAGRPKTGRDRQQARREAQFEKLAKLAIQVPAIDANGAGVMKPGETEDSVG